MELRPGERVDDLGRNGLRIIQHPGRFPFAVDPVLLAHFVTVKGRDRILDLGTGSGVVPLLLSALHTEARITGIEIQAETAEMARRSVILNDLESRIRLDHGDYREIGSIYGYEEFDVVTMNPPYREPGRGRINALAAKATARHELTGALPDALKAASQAVRFRGRVAAVFLAERLVDLLSGMRQAGLEPKRLRLVQPRPGTAANLCLVEAVKGGGVGLSVLAPLSIYAEGQMFSPEMQTIYGHI